MTAADPETIKNMVVSPLKAKAKAAPDPVEPTPAEAAAEIFEFKTLASKLSEVMGLMRSIKKDGFNDKQKYKFVRESDVAERASQLLAERGIWVEQTVLKHKRAALYTTQSGMTMWLSSVEMEFRFVDGATGEATAPRMFPGEGADTGDKGIYKAMTGAEKYFLMKSFFVSTGDDPEADTKVDTEEAAKEAASGPVKVERGKQQGVQRGGKSSLITMTQVNAIARLAKSAGLDADGVMAVVSKIVGSEPTEGQSLRDWMGGFTADQGKAVIAALSVGAATVETPVDTVDKPAEETVEEVGKEVAADTPVV